MLFQQKLDCYFTCENKSTLKSKLLLSVVSFDMSQELTFAQKATLSAFLSHEPLVFRVAA